MNASRASKLWSLGVLIALSAAACDAVDHPVGTETQEEPADGAHASATETDASNSGTDGADPSDSATDGSDSATDGGDSGTGGAGNLASGSASWTSGGLLGAAHPGVWGDLPIPEDCTVVFGAYAYGTDGEEECELEVECAGSPASSFCTAVDDYFECECLHTNPVQGFHLTRTTITDACVLTVAACLGYPELEAGPYECLPSADDVDEPDHCSSHTFCTREGVIGEATFSEEQERVAECSEGPEAWSCSCEQPILFEFPSTASPPQCGDARDWCAGEGVERIGSRSCHPLQSGEGEGICTAAVECEQAVRLSGQEAVMLEMDSVECSLASEGLYQCRCSWEGPYTQIAAEDLPSACENGVSVCESD